MMSAVYTTVNPSAENQVASVFFSRLRVHQVEGKSRGVSRLFLEVLRKPVHGISAGSLLSRIDGPYSSPSFTENLKYNFPLIYAML